MKKTLLPLSLSLVVVFLAGCSNSNARKVSDKNVYLMQAATGLNIASGVSTSSKMINRSFSDQDKNDIKEILPTLDMMFDNNSLFTSTVNEVNVDIDGKNYQYEEVIKYVNSSLEEGSYRLVYNIDKNNLEEDQDDGEVEQESLVSGLAFIDESTSYPFYSKLEKEIEDNEHEEERMFVINTSETSQIIIKEEFEVEGNETEQELHYIVKENNVTTIDYKIELESENNTNEIEIETNNKEFKVKRNVNNGEITYEVSLKDSDVIRKITFKKEVDETGEVTFVEL